MPDDHIVGKPLVYLELPSDSPRFISNPRVAVIIHKLCANSPDDRDRPVHLPASVTTYVLTFFATKFPPFHATADDMEPDPRIERIDFGITLPLSSCGIGG